MEIICKLIALSIVIAIELFFGYLISLIPGSQKFIIIYAIITTVLTCIFAIGLEEKDF